MRTYEEIIEDLNGMIPEIHKNAVAHGWWEEKRKISEFYSLFHSECSEALEEYRDNKRDVYCAAYGSESCRECGEDSCEISPEGDCFACLKQTAETGNWVLSKPEGVIVELADVVLRILDYLGEKGEELKTLSIQDKRGDRSDFTDMLAGLHTCLSLAYYQAVTKNSLSVKDEATHLALTVRLIWDYADFRGYDIAEVVKIKHKFNVSRPYKHGGKRI